MKIKRAVPSSGKEMKMRTSSNHRFTRVLAVFLIMTLICGMASEAFAASFTSKKPTIDTETSCYMNGKLILKWSKVSGATKYEVYRSKNKSGSYKKFATVTKNNLSKKTTGEYYYKVRGIKGSKKSKFSDPVHVFAANSKISKINFSNVGGLQVRILVTNKSERNMNFLAGNVCFIYLIDLSTEQAVGYAMAGMDAAGSAGIIVPPGKQQALWLQAYDYQLWTTYNSNPDKYTWLTTMTFYPGVGSDVAIPFAIASGMKAAYSSVTVSTQ